jgi:phosphoenolpyruvate carboxylase
MGSWIGGDRDGNPYVTAPVLRLAVESHATEAFEHHLGAIFGCLVSCRCRTASSPTDRLAVARRCRARRLAVPQPTSRTGARCAGSTPGSGRWRRSCSTRCRGRAARRPHAVRRRVDEIAADLDVVIDSLHSHGAGALADALVDPVRRGIEIFGTHLCGLDMRQNSEVHDQVVAELLRAAGVSDDYLVARRGRPRRRCSPPSCAANARSSRRSSTTPS